MTFGKYYVYVCFRHIFKNSSFGRIKAMTNLVVLEKKYDLELPEVYKIWIQMDGPSDPSFVGTDMDFPYLSELQHWAENLFKEAGLNFKLPEKSFVFAMHQGYQLYYFICDGSPDPEVWYYMEGDSSPTVLCRSLTEYLYGSKGLS
jgi:hypothetical protein